MKVKLSVKVKPFILLLYVLALPVKVVPEVTYTVMGGKLNHTHSVFGCHLHVVSFNSATTKLQFYYF